MKYLKSYKLFESIEDLDYDLIEQIKEILLPFSDMDMKVSCDYTSDGDKISLNIMTTKEKSFDVNQYKDDIDRLISYMKESGWDISKFNLAVVQDREGRKNWTLGYKYSKNYDEPLQYDKVKTPTFWIMAEFVKIVYAKAKVVKESQSDDIKLDISDILLELEELDIKSSVVDYTYRGIKCIRTRIFKYISWNHLGEPDNGLFVLEDILHVILRLKRFLESNNYKIDMGKGAADSKGPEPIDVFIEKYSTEKFSDIWIYIYKQ